MTEIFNRIETKETRRRLRHESTVTEDRLWMSLKNRQLANQKFRRQFNIGQYFVDFYCPKHRLVIEVDGSVHEDEEVKTNDSIRQEFLESLGLTILRFKNSDINFRIEFVLKTIKEFLIKTPLLAKERGWG